MTWYLSSLTLHKAVFGTVRPLLGSRRHGQACFRNIWSVGITSTSYIFIATLDYPANNASLFVMNYSVRNFWHSNSLHCFNDTAESCELSDNVFETERKRLEMRALCFPPWPACLFTPAPKGIKLSEEDSTLLFLYVEKQLVSMYFKLYILHKIAGSLVSNMSV
jgi:hypothetical protein